MIYHRTMGLRTASGNIIIDAQSAFLLPRVSSFARRSLTYRSFCREALPLSSLFGTAVLA